KAADNLNTGVDGDPLSVQHHITVLRGVALEIAAGGALRLVADKDHIGAGVGQQRLEVVDDAASGAHAAGGNHNGGAAAVLEVVHQLEVVDVLDHGDQLVKVQGVATF